MINIPFLGNFIVQVRSCLNRELSVNILIQSSHDILESVSNTRSGALITHSNQDTTTIMRPTIALSTLISPKPSTYIGFRIISSTTTLKINLFKSFCNTNITFKLGNLIGAFIILLVSNSHYAKLYVTVHISLEDVRHNVSQLLSYSTCRRTHRACNIQSKDNRKTIGVFIRITAFTNNSFRVHIRTHFGCLIKLARRSRQKIVHVTKATSNSRMIYICSSSPRTSTHKYKPP